MKLVYCIKPTCLTAVRLVSVPMLLLLSVMTIAWGNRLDGVYAARSDLLYTAKERDGIEAII